MYKYYFKFSLLLFKTLIGVVANLFAYEYSM